MAEITVDEIASWYRSKENILSECGITLAGIEERKVYLHSAWADLDTSTKIARIIGWISGEFDFEILDRVNAETIYFRHESVSEIGSGELELAFKEFMEHLQQP